jgi:hypothetical protein
MKPGMNRRQFIKVLGLGAGTLMLGVAPSKSIPKLRRVAASKPEALGMGEHLKSQTSLSYSAMTLVMVI